MTVPKGRVGLALALVAVATVAAVIAVVTGGSSSQPRQHNIDAAICRHYLADHTTGFQRQLDVAVEAHYSTGQLHRDLLALSADLQASQPTSAAAARVSRDCAG